MCLTRLAMAVRTFSPYMTVNVAPILFPNLSFEQHKVLVSTDNVVTGTEVTCGQYDSDTEVEVTGTPVVSVQRLVYGVLHVLVEVDGT